MESTAESIIKSSRPVVQKIPLGGAGDDEDDEEDEDDKDKSKEVRLLHSWPVFALLGSAHTYTCDLQTRKYRGFHS